VRFDSFVKTFRGGEPTIELQRAQLASFSRKVPLLYVVIAINVMMLGYTHHGQSPDWLTIWFPALFATLAMIRIIVWGTAKATETSDEEVGRLLGRLKSVGTSVGLVIAAWLIALHYTGNIVTRGHVAVAVGMTVFAASSFLVHVRPAALTITGMVAIPFSLYLISTAEPVNVVVGVNLLLVAAAMVIIVFIVSNDFRLMVIGQSELKRLSDENAQLAALDSLTGLPNRRQFFARLGQLLAHDRRCGQLTVGVIDLDGFKPVNDLYGHVVGDKVLSQVAGRLTEIMRGRALVCRLGGDEFGVVIENCGSEAEILDFGMHVCSALEAPFVMHGAVANISGSIGFSVLTEDGADAMTLYEQADYALYHAKQNRRGRPVIFSAEHESQLRKRGQLDQVLRTANLDAETQLVFQPLVDAADGHVFAFEALARWHSPVLGLVPPSDFIPVAERSELICRLTQILLRKSLAAAAEWPKDIRLTFNLSVRDIISPASILQIISVVNASGVDPRRIDFEMTETALMLDFGQAQNSIRALRALGAGISMDDFGTGYSSLSYVHRLPLDKIKIDRSFVADIETTAACRNIVKTVVGLCKDLEIDCIVEGIETEGQAQILRDLGCNSMQGYLFGKPMAGSQISNFLSRRADQTKIVA